MRGKFSPDHSFIVRPESGFAKRHRVSSRGQGQASGRSRARANDSPSDHEPRISVASAVTECVVTVTVALVSSAASACGPVRLACSLIKARVRHALSLLVWFHVVIK